MNESGASDSLRDTVSEDSLYDTTISESVMENTTYYMTYPTPTEEGKILSTNESDIAEEASSTEQKFSKYSPSKLPIHDNCPADIKCTSYRRDIAE